MGLDHFKATVLWKVRVETEVCGFLRSVWNAVPCCLLNEYPKPQRMYFLPVAESKDRDKVQKARDYAFIDSSHTLAHSGCSIAGRAQGSG